MLKVNKDKSKPLPDKELKILIALAQKGNIAARQKLISHNFRFIVAIVSSIFKNKESPIFDDLIQEGVIGLDKAITKFDLKKNLKFISYAIWWIRNSIFFYYRANMSIIRFPDNISQALNQLNRRNSIQEVQALGGDSFLSAPGISQTDNVSKALNLKVVPEENKDGDNIFDTIASPKDVEKDFDFRFSDLNLRGIKSKDLDLLKNKFLSDNISYGDIAKTYGVSREAIRQRVKSTIEKLRENNKKFLSF